MYGVLFKFAEGHSPDSLGLDIIFVHVFGIIHNLEVVTPEKGESLLFSWPGVATVKVGWPNPPKPKRGLYLGTK